MTAADRDRHLWQAEIYDVLARRAFKRGFLDEADRYFQRARRERQRATSKGAKA
jgi:hypothetical protein